MKRNLEEDTKHIELNKLVIIGNGFDLAHGLKTDYNSFIEYIYDQTVTPLIEKINLFKSPIENFLHETRFFKISCESSKDIAKYLEEIKNGISKVQKKSEALLYILNHRLTENVNSILLKVLSSDSRLWLDLEGTYFELLTNTEENFIQQLNKEFEILKNELEIYLKNEVEHKIDDKIWDQ